MRHPAITLTMDTYGHLFPGQDAAAVAALPSMMSGPQDSPEAQRATGTDGAAAGDPDSMRGQMRGQLGRKTLPDAANPYELDEDSQNEEDDRKVLPSSDLRDDLRDVARRGKVRLLGLEPRAYGLKVHREPPENIGKSGFSCEDGTKSAARIPELDADLQAVIDRWHDLPEAIKAGILAMVRTAAGS